MSSSTLPPYLTTSPSPVSPPPSTVRLQALYASTSAQRQSNPTGYSANVSWWSTLIEELLRSGYLGEDHLILKVDDGLLAKLEWNGAKPRGLGGFIERLSVPPSTLYPFIQYMTAITPLHASPSLTSRFIGRPLWWALGQLNPFGGGGSEEVVIKEETIWGKYGKGREYVHMSLLEEAFNAFTSYIRENPATVYSESLYSTTSFFDEFSSICFPRRKDGKGKDKDGVKLSKRDMEVVLKWLTRDCGVVVVQGDVIKVLAEGEKVADHPITEADIGVVAIRDTLKRLDQQVDSIEKQIQRCQQKAKHHLSLFQKPIALSHLKSKKQLEDLLLKRISSTNQLEQVLRSIDQAKGDIEIMSAYTTSTSTLKEILSNPALDLDHVEKTTEELAEVMASQREVDDAIKLGGEFAVGSSGEVDDEDLRMELEGMVRDQKEKEAQAQVLAERIKQAQLAEKEKEKVVQKPVEPPINTKKAEEEAEKVWRERYEEAQQRKKEEGQRAEVERMREQEKMAAE